MADTATPPPVDALRVGDKVRAELVIEGILTSPGALQVLEGTGSIGLNWLRYLGATLTVIESNPDGELVADPDGPRWRVRGEVEQA